LAVLVSLRDAEGKAAELAMWIASSIREVSEEEVRRVVGGHAGVRVYRVDEGLYQVELYYPPEAAGEGRKPALVIVLVEQPGWVSPVTYLGHSIQDMEAFSGLFEELQDDMERWRATQQA
jgi:hypothetical protein